MATNIEVISTIQLERKLYALKDYEEQIINELNKRNQKNSTNPRTRMEDTARCEKTAGIPTKSRKKKKIQKQRIINDDGTPRIRSTNITAIAIDDICDNKSKTQIKAGVIAMKNILNKNGIKFKNSDNKSELSNLLRKNYLIRLAESEQLLLKSKN